MTLEEKLAIQGEEGALVPQESSALLETIDTELVSLFQDLLNRTISGKLSTEFSHLDHVMMNEVTTPISTKQT